MKKKRHGKNLEKYRPSKQESDDSKMKELQQIVVAIDFSRFCINALQEAARMAQWSGAKLVVVHVVDEAALDAMRSQASDAPCSVLTVKLITG